ncbi:MAG: hypothetical protein NTV57_20140 [Cyanobacteria bacterium]|nr:hypothetical protein [Cyanobacteriota bacterium]
MQKPLLSRDVNRNGSFPHARWHLTDAAAKAAAVQLADPDLGVCCR